MLEKTMRLNYLFDFYRSLLTNKQREYMTLYYLEDYSLVEIAEYTHVSRQAVYDNLKRTEKVLENYEEKLMLYEKFQQRKKMLEQLEESLINGADLDEQLKYVHQLIEIG